MVKFIAADWSDALGLQFALHHGVGELDRRKLAVGVLILLLCNAQERSREFCSALGFGSASKLLEERRLQRIIVLAAAPGEVSIVC